MNGFQRSRFLSGDLIGTLADVAGVVDAGYGVRGAAETDYVLPVCFADETPSFAATT